MLSVIVQGKTKSEFNCLKDISVLRKGILRMWNQISQHHLKNNQKINEKKKITAESKEQH